MRAPKQLLLLLWKNWLIQRRQPAWTVMELFLPALLSSILVYIRTLTDSVAIPESRYEPWPVSGTWRDMNQTLVDNYTIFNPPCFIPINLYYSPNTSAAKEIMDDLAGRMVHIFAEPTWFMRVAAFADEKAMVDAVLARFNNEVACDPAHDFSDPDFLEKLPVWGGIHFDDGLAQVNTSDWNGTLPSELKYTIRLANLRRNDVALDKPSLQSMLVKGWMTALRYPMVPTLGPRSANATDGAAPGYWREGFLTLQRGIDDFLIRKVATFTNETVSGLQDDVNMQRFGYPQYKDNEFIKVLQQQLPSILLFSLIVSVLYMTRNIIIEKETHLKEYMKVMGLAGWLHWLSHLITNFLKLMIATGFITILLCVEFNGRACINHADPTVFWVFLMLYALAAICYSFMISTFFKSGNTGAACAGIVFVILSVPYAFLYPQYATLSYNEKMGSMILNNMAMSWGAQIISIFEASEVGIQWSNLRTPGTIDDNLTMSDVFIMLLVDSAICLIITWYVDAVYPGGDGVPEKPWFPFQASYWIGNRVKQIDLSNPKAREYISSLEAMSSTHFEPDPDDMKAEVVIDGLAKTYGSGERAVKAVSGLSVRLFPGQITALLGHNGAGKSTTMSMLTGIIPPSSGTATIAGYDIRTALSKARQYMGLCPQYNVLFEQLTVKEHLQMFCKLKDRKFDKTEYKGLLKALALEKKAHKPAGTLSGGMKRKLSMAIALIGGSEIVMLDEPTSGMDPGARHDAWTLLQQEKQNRTILLSTHYMEEADLLGDQIAILARGQLQCSGSPLFLKGIYGCGYHVTVVFNKDEKAGISRDAASQVLQVLRHHCPEARLQSAIGLEATYMIPDSYREQFEPLFAELESRQSELRVNAFGVSVTTMEEVFLEVGRIADEHTAAAGTADFSVLNVTEMNRSEQSLDSIVVSETSNELGSETSSTALDDKRKDNAMMENLTAIRCDTRVTGFVHWGQQYAAMLMKHSLHSVRHWKMLVVQMFVPILYCGLGLVTNLLLPTAQEQTALIMDLRQWDSPTVLMHDLTNDSEHSQWSMRFHQAYKDYMTENYNAIIKMVPASADMDDFIVNMYDSTGHDQFDYNVLIGSEFKEMFNDTLNATVFGVKALFNNQPFHMAGVTMNAVNNALLRTINNSNHRITTVNHPLPPSAVDKLNDWMGSGVAEYNITFQLIMGLSFMASSLCVFLIKERVTKSKHLQFLSGLHPFTYWFAAWSFDMVIYTVPAIGVLIMLKAFNQTGVLEEGRWLVTLFMMYTFGWSIHPMMYAASFLFESPAAGFVKMAILNITIAIITTIVDSVLFILNLTNARNICQWCFLFFFPHYALPHGLTTFFFNEFIRRQCKPIMPFCEALNNATAHGAKPVAAVGPCCDHDNALTYTNNTLAWNEPGVGRAPFFMIVQGILYWLLIFLIEVDVLRPLRYSAARTLGNIMRRFQSKPKPSENVLSEEDEANEQQGTSSVNKEYALESGSSSSEVSFGDFDDEPDVAMERNRVSHLDTRDEQNALVMRNLSKYYGSFKAVDRLCFAVSQNECFGLLGINGAGKTSTFQMLTGENLISGGDATVNGVSVRKNWRKAGANVGYCPQFDALIGKMTCVETLRMYALLRGIPTGQLNRVIAGVIEAVGIKRYSYKLVNTLSGGNKRRLSLGVSLVGMPKMLLLDEPTTGVDPAARRAIWKILSTVGRFGTAMVLTSHSMEECEALCSRLTIMAGGRLRCIGSPQHIKSKYGQGYTLQVKVADKNDVPDALEAIQKSFEGALVKEIHNEQLTFEIPSSANVSYSRLFGSLQRLLSRLHLVDYSLSQTTLEQVFLEFSRQARSKSVSKKTQLNGVVPAVNKGYQMDDLDDIAFLKSNIVETKF